LSTDFNSFLSSPNSLRVLNHLEWSQRNVLDDQATNEGRWLVCIALYNVVVGLRLPPVVKLIGLVFHGGQSTQTMLLFAIDRRPIPARQSEAQLLVPGMGWLDV
jgi:hypothetical protein